MPADVYGGSSDYEAAVACFIYINDFNGYIRNNARSQTTIEKFVIERTLQRTGGNKQKAANLLGIYRPRLYSKIKKYKIGLEAVSAN